MEVKALNEANTSDTALYLRRLLSHGDPPSAARYVLLITAQTGYLWTSTADVLRAAPSVLTFPIASIIRKLVPDANEGTRLRDFALEVLIEQWLWNAVDDIRTDEEIDGKLSEVGFLDAVRGGTVNVFATV